jgi:hypothetical protein
VNSARCNAAVFAADKLQEHICLNTYNVRASNADTERMKQSKYNIMHTAYSNSSVCAVTLLPLAASVHSISSKRAWLSYIHCSTVTSPACATALHTLSCSPHLPSGCVFVHNHNNIHIIIPCTLQSEQLATHEHCGVTCTHLSEVTLQCLAITTQHSTTSALIAH